VVIIPGKATGFASVALPDAANSIIIDGDPALVRPGLGFRVLGLGHFYSVTTGTTLVASAPGVASTPASSAGHVYAYHGQTGTAGVIAAADQVIAGPATGTRIGLTLFNLGPMLGPLNAVGVGNTADTVDFPGVNGAAYVMSGTAVSGPLTNKIILSLGGGAGVGAVVLGGALSGRDVALSLVGDGTPDLVLGASVSGQLSIFDGSKLAAKGSPVESTSAAEVQVTLPAGWTTGEQAAALLPDVNGDGFPDFCLGNAFGAVPGGVAVYW
jgi:hypothetical protein